MEIGGLIFSEKLELCEKIRVAVFQSRPFFAILTR